MNRAHSLLLAVVMTAGTKATTAHADDPHQPAFTDQLAACASRVTNLSVPIDAVIPIGGAPVYRTTVPGHPNRDPNDYCNDFSWVSTAPGYYDHILLGAEWGGPEINQRSDAQNAWDCAHSALTYGVFGSGPNVFGPTGLELKASGVAWGRYDAVAKKCRHDWDHNGIPPNSGTSSAAFDYANHYVIALQSWQHNDVHLSHGGTYCADNQDPNSSCLWPTKLTFVRNGTHFPNGRPYIGVFNGGKWWLDQNGNGAYDATGDRYVSAFGQPGDIPVIRNDRTGTRSMIGVNNNRTAQWWFDTNLNYAWDGGDTYAVGFGQPGDLPFAGYATSGTAFWEFQNIGVYNGGNWWLDGNANQAWNGTCSSCDFFTSGFGQPGDTPVMGLWQTSITPANGSKKGVFRDGSWWLDYDGDGQWSSGDRFYSFGTAGDKPIVGDWNGTGYDKVGVFRNGKFYLDWNGDGRWSWGDVVYLFGQPADTPVVGVW